MKYKNKKNTDFFQSLEYFQKTMKDSTSAASASYGLITSILIFTYIGWYIDSQYDTSPFAMVSGIFIGIFIGFYSLFRIMRSK